MPSPAQTIRVDATPSHATNHFRPNETLGAGIDRIPSEAVDTGLTQPNLARAMASGWQPVSYRNNTELSIEAWHWNPQGTWSESGEKGYFTGSTALGEPIRYSYGYSLPHRGFTRNDGTPNAGFSRITDGDENSYWKSNPYLTEHFTGDDPMHGPTRGVWETFPQGAVEQGRGGSEIMRLNATPLPVRFLRIL